jgi:hypothetical protein
MYMDSLVGETLAQDSSEIGHSPLHGRILS